MGNHISNETMEKVTDSNNLWNRIVLMWHIWRHINSHEGRIIFISSPLGIIENYQHVCAECAIKMFSDHVRHYAMSTKQILLNCKEDGEETQS